jgi:hypothetical protein
MYQAPLQSASKDDYLLGKEYKEDQPDLQSELNKTGIEKGLAAQRSAADDWTRTHNDPLLEMKQKEKNALEAIQSNPVKMARLKAALGIVEEKKEKNKKKKKKKDEKKRKKEKKERSRSRSRSRSPRRHRRRYDSDEDDSRRSRRERSRSRSRERQRRRQREYSRSRSNSRDRGDRRRGRRRSRSRERRRSPSPVVKKEELVVPVGYGLVFPGGKKPPSPQRERGGISSGSKEKEKEEEEVKVKKERGAEPRKKAKKMTAEEKNALLAQMTQDASIVQKDRGQRVEQAAEAEQQEEGAIKSDQAQFITELNRKVFMENESTLGDRMNATRHTRQRGPD